MRTSKNPRSAVEILESRIAPAVAVADAEWISATHGAAIKLSAGQGLSTGGPNRGTYLLFVEQGDAFVFTTDLNNNGLVDDNEITGIAAGDGLRLISFVNIHGDIVTNFRKIEADFPAADGTVTRIERFALTDSDLNAANDRRDVAGDGRVVLANTIEKITFRRLRPEDVGDQNGDGVVNFLDSNERQGLTGYSLYGNIFAGGGFGADDGGYEVDVSSSDPNFGDNFQGVFVPHVPAIYVGTSVSGHFFSFGASNGDDITGRLTKFLPGAGVEGASINGFRMLEDGGNVVSDFLGVNVTGFFAGDGGAGAKGGDVRNVAIIRDDAGGYQIVPGNGGTGFVGGAGGSVLEYSDFQSNTSQVVVRSGRGGVGSNGPGGDAGAVSFGLVNAVTSYNIELGSGGDGFTRGGKGASVVSGEFAQPGILGTVAADSQGTTHFPGSLTGSPTAPAPYVPRLGTYVAIDINADGFGDYVYTNKETSQLVVMFGNPDYDPTVPGSDIFKDERLYLPTVRNPDALTVADLNGDGRLDIAVGSSDRFSSAGVQIFYAIFENENGGPFTGAEDLNGNGVDDFLRFSEGRFNPLPNLTRFDSDSAINYAATNFYNGGFPIHRPDYIPVTDLVAGDFDGDGRPELAVSATYEGGVQVALILKADIEIDATGNSFYSGRYYADFGTKRVSAVGGDVDPVPILPVARLGGGTSATLDVAPAAATGTGSTYDLLWAGAVGAASFRSYDFSVRTPTVSPTGIITPAEPILLAVYPLPGVTAPTACANEGAQATVGKLAVADFSGDGLTDIVVISDPLNERQNAYIFPYISTGNGGFAAFLENYSGEPGCGGFAGNSTVSDVRAIDTDGDGMADEVLTISAQGGASYVNTLEAVNIPLLGWVLNVTSTDRVGDGDDQELDLQTFVDAYYHDLDTTVAPLTPYAVSSNGRDGLNLVGLFVGQVPDRFPIIDQLGFRITSGDGGNSFVGSGGDAGQIGDGTASVADFQVGTETVTGVRGSVHFILEQGSVELNGGVGGNGFSKGGTGASIAGVSAYGGTVNTSLYAGNGGRGVAAEGGAGGSIRNTYIQNLNLIIAGDGGTGYVGGDGGSIFGSMLSLPTGGRIPDSLVTEAVVNRADGVVAKVVLEAGRGGNGTRGGGDGGSIENYIPLITFLGDGHLSSETGSLDFRAGDGGDSVAGPGGNGGSIVRSQPAQGGAIRVVVELDIDVFAGNGGEGSTGGNGGSIDTFGVRNTQGSEATALLSVIAGRGGNGTFGSGGVGGAVTGVDVVSRGRAGDSTGSQNFSRVLAGEGGDSSRGSGGAGGSILNVRLDATQGSVAIVAGEGGSGLLVGGPGGNVIGSQATTSASTTTKALVIAGKGGDAFSYIPNPRDSTETAAQKARAFGGRIGVGGTGGSIIGFTQQGNTLSHADLIAGNGGDTLNYGTIFDPRPYAGSGGSIANVTVAGELGNVASNVPLKSYNDLLNGETVADWIANKLIDLNGGDSLTDSDGNVGIIVGAAGRIKEVFRNGTYESQPSNQVRVDGRILASNGELYNVEASNLASAVAGSVDRIAAIQVARGIKVLNGILGADKSIVGTKEFLTPDGLRTIETPVRDSRLIDGVIAAGYVTDLRGAIVSLPGNIVTFGGFNPPLRTF